VIQYAVDVLEVKDIIVCGHYNCGGVKAALQEAHPQFTALNEWLLHVREVYRAHRAELGAIASADERANRLVQINVVEQVKRLSQTTIVQSAWKKRGRPFIHGWVFGLEDGLLRQLITLKPDAIGE
jgi:carbonic anhydrase